MKSTAKRDSPMWKPVWAMTWRYFLLAPLLAPLGVVLLVLVLAYPLLPPAYALGMILGGDWLRGLAVLGIWGIGMIFYKRVFYTMFEGYRGL